MNCGGERVEGGSSESVTQIGMTLLIIFTAFFFVLAQYSVCNNLLKSCLVNFLNFSNRFFFLIRSKNILFVNLRARRNSRCRLQAIQYQLLINTRRELAKGSDKKFEAHDIRLPRSIK